MTRPDMRAAYRDLSLAWTEARGLPKRRDRWQGYGIVVAAHAVLPIVALVIWARGDGD